jgi:hypothetical protein
MKIIIIVFLFGNFIRDSFFAISAPVIISNTFIAPKMIIVGDVVYCSCKNALTITRRKYKDAKIDISTHPLCFFK